MSLIGYFFPKFQTAKYVAMQMSIESCFSTPQDSHHVEGSLTLLQPAPQQFDHLFSSLWENFCCKKYFLVISEILRPIANSLTPNEMYPPDNRENLLQPIQMKLSQRLKLSAQLFTAFLKSTFNFKHFEKKDESQNFRLSEIKDYEIRAYVNVYTVMFQYTLGLSTC